MAEDEAQHLPLTDRAVRQLARDFAANPKDSCNTILRKRPLHYLGKYTWSAWNRFNYLKGKKANEPGLHWKLCSEASAFLQSQAPTADFGPHRANDNNSSLSSSSPSEEESEQGDEEDTVVVSRKSFNFRSSLFLLFFLFVE